MMTIDSTTSADVEQAFLVDIQNKIQELRESLQQSMPNYESLVHTIHRMLTTNPTVAHIMTDEEIGIVVRALEKKTGMTLIAEAAKSSKSKKIVVEDL